MGAIIRNTFFNVNQFLMTFTVNYLDTYSSSPYTLPENNMLIREMNRTKTIIEHSPPQQDQEKGFEHRYL